MIKHISCILKSIVAQFKKNKYRILTSQKINYDIQFFETG